ncbi:MAG: hypothetical protein ABI295_03590 [Xanthomarina sp.]
MSKKILLGLCFCIFIACGNTEKKDLQETKEVEKVEAKTINLDFIKTFEGSINMKL